MLCLTMIVRDEAAVIGRCLESVREQINYWVIVDTGSHDGTPEVIDRCLAGIPGELHHRPWRDFAHNRTESLEWARGKADWHLILDADEILDGMLAPTGTATSHEIEVRAGGTRWMSKRLLRDDLDWSYVGAAHAVPTSAQPDDQPRPLPDVTIIHHNDGGCKTGRRQRNRQLLTAAVERDPDDARSWFYLAQECRHAGDIADAIRAYRRRIRLGGWPEEIWYSHYQLGLLLPYGIASLEHAHELRPQRMEAVHALAQQHRHQHLYRTAHLWASHGVEVNRPTDDRLFVAQWIYDWGLVFEFSITASRVGEHETAARAFAWLLARKDLPAAVREATERNAALMPEVR